MSLAEADALADRFGADRIGIGEEVRAVVRAKLPLLAERIDDRRDSFAFVFERGSVPIVSVIISARSVLLYFHRGVALPDPSGILRGDGRRGRYFCVRRAEMAHTPRIAMLLEAALFVEERA